MAGSVFYCVPLEMSETMANNLETMCEERYSNPDEMIIQAIGLLHLVHCSTKSGSFVGLTRYRDRLDTVLVLPPDVMTLR